MPKMYNEDGEVIYAGRGKRSFRARALIAQRKAYVRNAEGQLVVYVPEITHASELHAALDWAWTKKSVLSSEKLALLAAKSAWALTKSNPPNHRIR